MLEARAPGRVCFRKTWSFFTADKIIDLQHPLRVEIWPSPKVGGVGTHKAKDLQCLWTKVHHCFLFNAGVIVDG